jgi:hypothetical protein
MQLDSTDMISTWVNPSIQSKVSTVCNGSASRIEKKRTVSSSLRLIRTKNSHTENHEEDDARCLFSVYSHILFPIESD